MVATTLAFPVAPDGHLGTVPEAVTKPPATQRAPEASVEYHTRLPPTLVPMHAGGHGSYYGTEPGGSLGYLMMSPCVRGPSVGARYLYRCIGERDRLTPPATNYSHARLVRRRMHSWITWSRVLFQRHL